LLLTATVSNAETVNVLSPTTYTDNSAIASAVTLNVYDNGVCSGTLYGTGTSPAPPSATTPVAIVGPTKNAGTYSFVANAKVGGGSSGACSTSVAWVIDFSVTVSGPTSVNEGATASYTVARAWTANGGATTGPAGTVEWSVSGTAASIDLAGVLNAGLVTTNTDVTVTARVTDPGGAVRTDTQLVTILNVASTTPVQPNIQNIVR
jgi:hypothetical protein